MVHNPVLNETFTATRGGGAHLNGQRIHCSATSALGSALVATGALPGGQTDCLMSDCLQKYRGVHKPCELFLVLGHLLGPQPRWQGCT